MGESSLTLTFRPAVAMHQITCLPHVVALAVAQTDPDWAVRWPHDVCVRRSAETVCAISAKAGYDGSMFCTVKLDGLSVEREELVAAIEALVDAWERGLSGRPRMAPLAGVLDDYATSLWRLGEGVSVLYPNGTPFAQGTFVGIDIWGKASVRLDDGRLLEFGPERYTIAS